MEGDPLFRSPLWGDGDMRIDPPSPQLRALTVSCQILIWMYV